MKTNEEVIAERISEELGVDSAEVKPEQVLDHDLGADSMDIVEIALGLEEDFEIEIKDPDFEAWRTVGDVIQTIGDAKQRDPA